MAKSRRTVGAGHQAAWAEIFRAMGDRTRLSILLKLLEGEMCVTDLGKALKLDTPTISFHLTKLRYSGLVTNERRGQQVFYKISARLLKSSRNRRVLTVEGVTMTFPKLT